MRLIRPRRAGGSRRWVKRGALAATGLLVLVVAAFGGYNWYLNGEVHRVEVKNLSRAAGPGAEASTQNILLVGSTSRCALKVQNPAFGLCSQGVTGVNGDVIMVLHLDPRRHRAAILSIPRDLFVPNARVQGANKIDAALYEGPGQLVNAIQEDFGIPIQHYVELNFDTFAGVVNALGGVRMYFPMPVFDAYSGLRVMTPGCRTLNGFQALQVVRARHLQYKAPGVTSNDPRTWPQEVQSDLARIRRDHEFLRVLAAKVKRQGLGNPITDERIAAAVAPQLQVDSGLSAFALAHLMLEFHSLNPYSAPAETLPVVVTTFGSYVYGGGNYGDVEFTAQPQDQQVVDDLLGVSASVNTMTGQPLPKPGSVRVAVLNATGVAGQAHQTARSLAALGFQVTGESNTQALASHEETLVAYRSPSGEAAAQRVLHSLSGFAVMAFDPSLVPSGASVAVVTGTGFAVAPPAAAPPAGARPAGSPGTGAASPGPAGSPAAGGSPGGSSVAGGSAPGAGGSPAAGLAGAGYQPPSPAVTGLRPWDPRSCTPGGGEGP